jgi:hypothetical protein
MTPIEKTTEDTEQNKRAQRKEKDNFAVLCALNFFSAMKANAKHMVKQPPSASWKVE